MIHDEFGLLAIIWSLQPRIRLIGSRLKAHSQRDLIDLSDAERRVSKLSQRAEMDAQNWPPTGTEPRIDRGPESISRLRAESIGAAANRKIPDEPSDSNQLQIGWPASLVLARGPRAAIIMTEAEVALPPLFLVPWGRSWRPAS